LTTSYSGELRTKEKEIISEVKFFTIEEIEKLNSQHYDKVTEFLLEKLKEGEIIHIIGKEITRFHAIY